MTTTGERLQKLRIERDLSMQELADLVGVHKGTIFKWEHDQVPLRKASSENLAALARVLHTTPEALVSASPAPVTITNPEYELRNGSTVVRVGKEKPRTESEDRLLFYALDILAMQNGFRIDYSPEGDVFLVNRAGIRREITEQDLRDVTTDLSSLAGMSFRRLFGGQS